MKYFPMLVLAALLSLATSGFSQESSPTAGSDDDPLAELLVLAERLDIASKDAEKIFEESKVKAAERFPRWQLLLSSAQQVLDGLSGGIRSAEEVLSQEKEASLPQNPAEKAFVLRQRDELETELESMLLKQATLTEAVSGLEARLAKIGADKTVDTLVKARKASESVDATLGELDASLRRIKTGKLDEAKPKVP
jgi:hypothetical protein